MEPQLNNLLLTILMLILAVLPTRSQDRNSNVVKSANGVFAAHKEIEHVKKTAILMLTSHPDADKEMLKMFQRVDSQIMFMDTSTNIDPIFDHISMEDESIINPWQKFKSVRDTIGQFYGTFQNFLYNRAYYDDSVLHNFAIAHKSEEALKKMQKLIVPKIRSDSFLYKLYRSLWLQVALPLLGFGFLPWHKIVLFFRMESNCAHWANHLIKSCIICTT